MTGFSVDIILGPGLEVCTAGTDVGLKVGCIDVDLAAVGFDLCLAVKKTSVVRFLISSILVV